MRPSVPSALSRQPDAHHPQQPAAKKQKKEKADIEEEMDILKVSPATLAAL
jgi:hypothetical protein